MNQESVNAIVMKTLHDLFTQNNMEPEQDSEQQPEQPEPQPQELMQ